MAEYLAEKGRRGVVGTAYDYLVNVGGNELIRTVSGSSTIFGSVLRDFIRAGAAEKRQASRIQRAIWREEHKAWLKDNQWRFDFRSQPRRPAGTDDGGEWMEGRLDYAREQKRPVSRKQLRLMRRQQRDHQRWVKSNMAFHTANKKRFIQSSFARD